MSVATFELYLICGGCKAQEVIVERTPTQAYWAAIDRGWHVDDTSLCAGGRWDGCPEHPSGQHGLTRQHTASCWTCGDDWEGTEDECYGWAEEHRCEPMVTVKVS